LRAGARIEVDGRQQRRAGDLGLCVGLEDLRDSNRDIEIGLVCLLDERC